MTSRFGHYYDHVAAGLGYVSLFAGLGIGLRSSWLGSWAPVAGVLAAGSIAIVFLIRVFLEELLICLHGSGAADLAALRAGGILELP